MELTIICSDGNAYTAENTNFLPAPTGILRFEETFTKSNSYSELGTGCVDIDNIAMIICDNGTTIGDSASIKDFLSKL